MLRMTVFGLLQTLFFAFLLKSHLDLSWSAVLITLLTVSALLFSRAWYLATERKRSHRPQGM